MIFKNIGKIDKQHLKIVNILLTLIELILFKNKYKNNIKRRIKIIIKKIMNQ